MSDKLRVWWKRTKTQNWFPKLLGVKRVKEDVELSGIIVGFSHGYLLTRTDEGRFYEIYLKDILRSKWVR